MNDVSQVVLAYGALTTAAALLGWRWLVQLRERVRAERLDTPRAVAHDIRSLVSGIHFGVSTMAAGIEKGRTPSFKMLAELRRSSRFATDLFEVMSSPATAAVQRFDLWAVAFCAAAVHPSIEFASSHDALVVEASQLDAARLLGLLFDNALEHGRDVEVLAVPTGMVIRNRIAAPPCTASRRAGRGTGLVHARALACRLGLDFDARPFENHFVVTLTREAT